MRLPANEAMRHGVSGEVNIGRDAQFSKDPCALGMDDLHAAHQLKADLLNGLASQDHDEDLEFATGKKFLRWSLQGIPLCTCYLFVEVT